MILNFKKYNDTITLLRSLKKQEWFNNIKIYIVENGSKNESLEVLDNCKKKYNFDLIVSDINLGFAKGNNLGIKKAREDGCEFIICSNPDIIIPFQKDFLKIIIDIFTSKKASVISPDIREETGGVVNPYIINRFSRNFIKRKKMFYKLKLDKIYCKLRLFPGLYSLFNLISKIKGKNDYINRVNNQKERYIYAGSGCFLIFTPLFFEYYEGFDEGTFLFGEGFILGERLYQQNLKWWYSNKLKVIHRVSSTTKFIYDNSKDRLAFALKHLHRSYRYYFLEVVK